MSPENSFDRRRQRPPGPRRSPGTPELAIQNAIRRGYVIGREVLIGQIPGIIVGYNIGAFGRFVGVAFPLVIRTALGVTKCAPDEVDLV